MHLPTACRGNFERLLSRYAASVETRTYVVHTSGGFGNEMDSILHAFLWGLLDGRRILVKPTYATLWTYMQSNRWWTVWDGNRLPDAQHVKANNWLVGSPDDHVLWKNLSRVTDDVPTLVSCASHALFQPKEIVVRAIRRYVPNASTTVGVHLRSSDVDMMSRMSGAKRRLSLATHVRHGCMVGDRLIGAIRACRGSAGKTLFVASDSHALVRKEQIGPFVTSNGTAYHTGRPFVSRRGEDGHLKVLVDFFTLSSVGTFLSNCDLSCIREAWLSPSTAPSNVRCGNTFAGNVWIRRFVTDSRAPSMRECTRRSRCASSTCQWSIWPRLHHWVSRIPTSLRPV